MVRMPVSVPPDRLSFSVSSSSMAPWVCVAAMAPDAEKLTPNAAAFSVMAEGNSCSRGVITVAFTSNST